MESRLAAEVMAAVQDGLAATDRLLAEQFPGDDGSRQPLHTVYVPADRFTPKLPAEWGQAALDLISAQGGIDTVCRTVGVSEEMIPQIAGKVTAKLANQPIEDLRIDFEDGFGDRGDAAEDSAAAEAAGELASAVTDGIAPPFSGVRFKCLEAATRGRGLRTLELFLATLTERLGGLPDGFVVTLPKVSTVAQVEAMVTVCGALEQAYGLATGALRFEIQVETPQLIIGPDGRLPLAPAIHAGAGRVTGLHYGTYDYSAALQISAGQQASDHPAADFAKHVMQVVSAGTGVRLSDGSTNVLPLGEEGQVAAAWRLHAGLVRRALEHGFYQGWDLHAHQLPTRYIATFAFYRTGWEQAADRLGTYLGGGESAILDEPATARALARFLQRGLLCGAIDAQELQSRAGLQIAQVSEVARPRPA